MDWQFTLAWIAVGLAATYVGWRGSRALRSNKSGCGGGCGCANTKSADATSAPAIIPADQLVLRQKK